MYVSRQRHLGDSPQTRFLPGGFHAAAGLPAALDQAPQASQLPATAVGYLGRTPGVLVLLGAKPHVLARAEVWRQNI